MSFCIKMSAKSIVFFAAIVIMANGALGYYYGSSYEGYTPPNFTEPSPAPQGDFKTESKRFHPVSGLYKYILPAVPRTDNENYIDANGRDFSKTWKLSSRAETRPNTNDPSHNICYCF